MADCTMKVVWVKNPTYSDVKRLYECFENAAKQMEYDSISLHFNFWSGEMRYVVQSIEEFTEIAYGEKDFRLCALQFLAYLPNDGNVRINYLSDLTVSASSKSLLETFQEQLKLSLSFGKDLSLEQEKITGCTEAHAAVPARHNQGTSSSPITINGNGNVINVAGGSISDSQIKSVQKQIKPTKKTSGVKNFISGVFQGVVGNAVWWIFGIIVAAILGYFAIN